MMWTIGDVPISLPTYISDWLEKSEDNRTEFQGLVDSIQYALELKNKEDKTQTNTVTSLTDLLNSYTDLMDIFKTKN